MPMTFLKQPGQTVTKARAEAIESVLSFLALSEVKQEDWSYIDQYAEQPGISKLVKQFVEVPLRHFDGAQIDWLYESCMHQTSYEWVIINPNDPELKTLPLERWDVSQCVYWTDSPRLIEEYKAKGTYMFSLQRMRRIPLREVRGLFRPRSSEVLEVSDAHLFNDGTYFSNREYWQFFSGAWYCVGLPIEIDPPVRIDDDVQMSPWASKAIALSGEYDWQTHIGLNIKTTPAISMTTDPVSAKDVFKLRDIPPGKERREALRNWVSGHWRKSRCGEEYAKNFIWPHLRGSEEFIWNGLYCKIQPSAYDLRKAKEYQLMAAKEKARRA